MLEHMHLHTLFNCKGLLAAAVKSLREVLQLRLLLHLHRLDALNEVLVLDDGALAPEGQHACQEEEKDLEEYT